MAHCCKDCDRLRPSISGTAPARPDYARATKYDHFSNFQRFKQAKEEEEELIKARQEELKKLNQNFTNYQASKTVDTEEECGQYLTPDTAHCGQRVHALNRTLDAAQTKSMSATAGRSLPLSPKNSRTLVKKRSLLSISRTPVRCPIGSCGHTIGVTSVLSHLLRDHNDNFDVECQEIYGGKRSVLIFEAASMDFKDNVCLGVLAYGGLDTNSSSCPAERGLCMHNSFLPKTHEHLAAHMPILIMACRTSWNAMLLNKETEAAVTDATNIRSHLLVIWLVSGETTQPIHCTVTVFDKAMISSRSAIVQVRHLNESQNPSDFLRNDTNVLRLCRGEVDILSHGGSENIQMEIMVNEYDQ